MKSAILSVGTEILFGQITNTNTVYLSQELNQLGIDVMYHHTVGDNPKRVKEAITLLHKECDLVITTGGLGPTQDDLTKEMVCEIMGDTLVKNDEALERITANFKRMGREMTENNVKQAFMPSEATVFQNDVGTAPGFALERNGKIAICMPGPPREMKWMYENCAKAYLQNKTSCVIFSKSLRIFGIGESSMETEIEDLITNQTDPTIAPYAKEGEVQLRVTSKRDTLAEAEKSVDEMIEKINERIGEYIYSYDNEDLYAVVGKKLIEKKISISSAESCTAGMFASTLTNTSGISAVFDRAIVTYSNEAKRDELGVKKETLDQFGAVSPETALEMVEGLKTKTGSQLCIAVTGVAGPEGGTEQKPVGLVYVAVIFGDQKICKEFRMRAVNRNWNRNYTTLLMLDLVNKLIDEK